MFWPNLTMNMLKKKNSVKIQSCTLTSGFPLNYTMIFLILIEVKCDSMLKLQSHFNITILAPFLKSNYMLLEALCQGS